MDAVTQGLLAATTAQLGFRQKIGRDATWMAIIGGLAPDLDILVPRVMHWLDIPVDGTTMMQVHRGYSHSVLIAPLLSLPLAGLWLWMRRRWERKRRLAAGNSGELSPLAAARPIPFIWLYLCMLVAVVTHPLLDWCTSYGTQLLLPLTDRRYALDAVPIVDLIYTPLLMATLLACWLVRKLMHAPTVRATLIIAWAGFLLTTGYLVTGRLMHDRAVAMARQAVGDRNIVRAEAFPAVGSIFLWRGLIETEEDFTAIRVHIFNNGPPETFARTTVAKVSNEWTERAAELPELKTYRWFSDGNLRSEYYTAGGLHVVKFHDMRYGSPLNGVESFWPMVVVYDDEGELVSVTRIRRRPAGSLAANAWKDLWNP